MTDYAARFFLLGLLRGLLPPWLRRVVDRSIVALAERVRAEYAAPIGRFAAHTGCAEPEVCDPLGHCAYGCFDDDWIRW